MYDCGSGQTNQPSLLLLLRPIQFNCVCVSMFVFSQCRVGCVVSYRSCCSVHLFGGNPFAFCEMPMDVTMYTDGSLIVGIISIENPKGLYCPQFQSPLGKSDGGQNGKRENEMDETEKGESTHKERASEREHERVCVRRMRLLLFATWTKRINVGLFI